MKKTAESENPLISKLPKKIYGDGGERTLKVVKERLETLDKKSESSELLVKIPVSFWQNCFDLLINKANGDLLSYSTRQRYQRNLKEIFEHLKENHYISGECEIDIQVPQKHYRKQCIRLDKLYNPQTNEIYTLESFEQLLTTFSEQLKGITEIPYQLDDQQVADLFIVSCLLTGFVQNDPLQKIYALTWQDIPLRHDELSWMPYAASIENKAQDGFWYRSAPCTKLLGLGLSFRIRKQSPNKSDGVFSTVFKDIAAFRKSGKDALLQLYEKADTPKIPIESLIHLERLHLRLFIPSNLPLSVLSGVVKVNAVPRDQANQLFFNPRNKDQESWFVSNDEEDFEGEEADPVLEDENLQDLLQSYAGVFKEIQPMTLAFRKDPSRINKAEIINWIEANQTNPDLAVQNMTKLLGWLISMKVKKKTATRSSYWTAAIRVLKYFPDTAVEKIDQNAFKQFLTSEYEEQSLQLSKTAWKKFHTYLKEKKVTVPNIAWEKLRIKRKPNSVRILTNINYTDFLSGQSLPKHIGWAIRLSLWCGLRVSEVCRLRANDFLLHGGMILYVRPSKNGKRRRVSLEHLNQKRLKALQKLQAQRLKVSRDAFLLIDEQGEALQPKKLSAVVSKKFQEAGLITMKGKGRDIRYHSLRASAAVISYKLFRDIRFATQQLGHSMPSTTCKHYLNTLDLEAAQLIQNWNNPLFDENLHLPLTHLAPLMGCTPNHVRNHLRDYNEAHPENQLSFKLPDQLPDGPRPGRGGAPKQYLGVLDAITLLGWLISAG